MELRGYLRVSAFGNGAVEVLEVLLATERSFAGWFRFRLGLGLLCFELLLLLDENVGIDLVVKQLPQGWFLGLLRRQVIPFGIACINFIGKHLVLLAWEPVLGCFFDLFLLLVLRLPRSLNSLLLLGFGSLGNLLFSLLADQRLGDFRLLRRYGYITHGLPLLRVGSACMQWVC